MNRVFGADVSLDGGEAEPVDYVPKDCGAVGVEDNLAAFNCCTRGAGHAVDRLRADKTG